MGLEDTLTIEDGARLYVEHCKENKAKSKPIKAFFMRYNIKNNGFHSEGGTGRLNKYYEKFIKLRKGGKLPKGITTFEGWIGLQIPKKLKQRLEKLTEKYLKEYSLEQGVEFYTQYLKEHKERSKPIKRFFNDYNPEKKRILQKCGERKKLRRYYRKFGELKDDEKLPKGVTAFEDWIESQIPKELKQRLEELTGKYLQEYSLEQGVEFYIKHLEESKEKSKPIIAFFENYNPEKKKVLHGSGESKKLRKYYRRFKELKDSEKLLKGITTFEEWIGLQIPKKLKQRLEKLTEKYLKEYSVKEGVEFYIQHLQQNKEKSKPIPVFFMRYDIKPNGFCSEDGTGRLNKYYDNFIKLRKGGKLPKGITTFEGWIGLQIPKKLKQRLEKLTEKYLREYSVEEGVEFYIRYLEEHREESKPIISFFMKYDVGNNGLTSENGIRRLNKYYNNFIKWRKGGKLPEGITTFEDWIESQIPKELKQRLEELTGKYLQEYSLEQGVEFYIKHLEESKEKSKPIIAFFENYNPEKKKVLHGSGESKKLRKYYRRFMELKNNEKLSKGIATFEDYLVYNLPEEKRERAEYYLKGGFLKDVAKTKIDADRLRGIVLG